MKRLPLNESSFVKIRQNNFIYVDKTKYILDLVNTTTFVFLSRPRRFGKSLTVSTLAALFEGKKELFKGLYIYDKWEFKKYPILWFDFSEISNETKEILRQSILQKLQRFASRYGVDLPCGEPKDQLGILIDTISEKEARPVVILIDEYDKPILDHLGMGDEHYKIALENRDVLKKFFGVLKGGTLQTCIKFVFVTGISTFSKVSIFSEWNQLTDISLDTEFAGFTGYTQEELEHYFKDYLKQVAERKQISYDEVIQRLREWYDGYRFALEDETRVYNPISILHALQKKSFQNYWFATGTPSYLVNLLREKEELILDLDNLEVAPEFISIYDLENLPLEAVFYQSGYLTIKNVKEEPVSEVILGYPNREVYLSFNRVLLSTLYETKNQGLIEAKYLVQSLVNKNFTQAEVHINNLLSLIPNRLWKKIKDKEDENKVITEERFYQTIIYLALYASGYMADVEVINIGGFADLVLKYKGKVFIFEIKVKGNAKSAIEQIKNKEYFRKYQNTNKIYLIGLIMDTEKRRVKEMAFELLDN